MASAANLIPVLKSEFLFEALKNSYSARRLAPFQQPGSIPASKAWGVVIDKRDWYDFHKTYEFQARLKYHSSLNDTHGVVGPVWTNVDTGANYFQSIKYFESMINSVNIVRGTVTGKFRVIKTGFVYTLEWFGEADSLI